MIFLFLGGGKDENILKNYNKKQFQMITPLIILLFYLILTFITGKVLLAVNESIPHCLIYEENLTLENLCLKCEKSYVLN